MTKLSGPEAKDENLGFQIGATELASESKTETSARGWVPDRSQEGGARGERFKKVSDVGDKALTR